MKFVFVFVFAAGCGSVLPLHSEAARHNQRGAELLRTGALEDAEANFELALEYNKKFAEAWCNLGVVAVVRGELDLAEHRLKKAVALNRNMAQAWTNLGLVYERRSEIKLAVDAYEHAISIQPGLVDARLNLALVRVKQGDITAARTHLLRVVQIEPQHVVAQSILAYCDVRLGAFTNAEERVAAVLSTKPDSETARIVRGILLAHQHKYDAAEADFRVGLGDPVLGRAAATRLAAIQVARGARRQARRRVQALLAEDPDDGAIQLLAAWLRLDEGDWRGATRHAKRALELSHELEEAQGILQKACHMGRGTCTSPR